MDYGHTAHEAALASVGEETQHDLTVTDSREVAAGVWVVFLSDADNGQTITVTVAPSRSRPDALICTWWDDETTLHVETELIESLQDDGPTRLDILRSAERNGDEIVRLT